ncbi:MAG: hypothetical protein RR140_02300 [Clostridia bacterium]
MSCGLFLVEKDEVVLNHPKQKSMHFGHRTRLLSQIEKGGFDKLSEVNQLEFLLSLIIPQKDVNPISHKLIEKFNSLNNILSLSTIELYKSGIVSYKTADRLIEINRLKNIFESKFLKTDLSLSTIGSVANYIKNLFLCASCKCVVLFLDDSEIPIKQLELNVFNAETMLAIISKQFDILPCKFAICTKEQDASFYSSFKTQCIEFGAKLIDIFVIKQDETIFSVEFNQTILNIK